MEARRFRMEHWRKRGSANWRYVMLELMFMTSIDSFISFAQMCFTLSSCGYPSYMSCVLSYYNGNDYVRGSDDDDSDSNFMRDEVIHYSKYASGYL